MDKTKYTRSTFVRRDLLNIKQYTPDGTEESVQIRVALNASDEFWSILDESVERAVINIVNMLPRYKKGAMKGMIKHRTITKKTLSEAKKIIL